MDVILFASSLAKLILLFYCLRTSFWKSSETYYWIMGISRTHHDQFSQRYKQHAIPNMLIEACEQNDCRLGMRIDRSKGQPLAHSIQIF